MRHGEKCFVIGLIHLSGPSFNFFLESVQVSIAIHLDAETKLSHSRSIFRKFLDHFSILGVGILLSGKKIFALFGKQTAAFFWSFAFGENSLSVVDGISLFRVELVGSFS
jgi:hypothetical protein